MKNNCNLSPKVIKYLEEMAIEREISNQIRAAAERDWMEREGHKLFTDPNKVIGETGKIKIGKRIGQRMINLFRKFNVKDRK